MTIKNLSAKLKTTTTIILILLMASVTLMAMSDQPVQAATNMQSNGSVLLPAGVTPDTSVTTVAHLSFRPNPVGVGQTILVNMWLTPGSHPALYMTGYTVTITKPDGTVETKTMNSYPADTTAWFEYVVDQVGTYKLKFEFPGGYFPAGNYTAVAATYSGPNPASFQTSCYYKPSSTAEQTLVVQQDQVLSWPPSSLPTDYWTRPISPENREWWPIAGFYPATGVVGGGTDWPADTNPYMNKYWYIPYVQAPNTAHIVWRRQDLLGGLIGGAEGQKSASLGSVGGMWMTNTPSIVYDGRAYQTMTKSMPMNVNGTTVVEPTSVWECYDIRTGQVYWDQTGITQPPTVVMYDQSAGEVTGSVGYSNSIFLAYIGSGRLIKYDPSTGAVSVNTSIAPLTTGTVYDSPYVLSVQDLGAAAGAGANRYRLINWTMAGTTTNFTARIISNTTYALSSIPSLADYNAGFGASVTNIVSEQSAWIGMIVTGYNLYTGQMVWNLTRGETSYTSANVADHGKVAVLTQQGYYLAFDLSSGQLAWKSDTMDYPWDSSAFGGYTVQSAYGLFYRGAYTGVYAFNWTNGKIAWKYQAPSVPYETPYAGYYSFDANQAIIADRKIYIYNVEHTPTQPLTRGWKLHCINATSGVGIWNITGSMTPGAVADGYLAAGNSYDGYMYVFGKGKSATTVSAPQTAITEGQSVVLTGTVMDLSPAQPNTPCVSKESMTQWMEYLHMQHAIPANVTGVPVSIDAIDPNGNNIHIATVTSDMSGSFKKLWAPEVAGEYTITATFMGDDSYGSSWAETAVGVVQAPQATITPTPTQLTLDAINSTVMTTVIGGVIAIIIAIAIVGLLILRKRP